MSTNKQRREAERKRLQRQLEQRRQREIARRRFTLIASVVGTLAVIVIVIVIVVATTGGSNTKKPAAGASNPVSKPATTSAPATSAAPTPTIPCSPPTKAATASFKGVTVGYPTNLKHEPKVRSKSATPPASLECQDLVVGTGKAPTAASKVTIQYTGVLYSSGKEFDTSWGKSAAAAFSLAPGNVIEGFSQGIAGAGKVAPMKIGGRRIMILPASLAYGASGNGAVPANAALVFVVDLKSVQG